MWNETLDLVAETKVQDALRQAEKDRLTKGLSQRRWWNRTNRKARTNVR